MPRTIIIPREIEEKLDTLTSLKEESNGVLLYKRKGDLCSVEAMYMTGVGSEGHVQSDSRKLEVVNRFFQKNPEYGFVKFHTHTLGTIREFGKEYARKFSSGDIAGIREQFKHNREFIAMLITPETKLLSGLDNPQLSIVDRSEDYERNHKTIGLSLEQIANDLGMGHEIFKGTKIK